MYDVLVGKQRGLIFPVMCNAHVKIDYSDNVPSTTDNINYGIWAHTGSFTFESILTPYDINGVGQYSATSRPNTTSTQKVIPSVIFSSANSANHQSEDYLTQSARLTHEMRIFSSTNFYVSLLNSTLHNENQPAEYKIKVGLKIGGTDYTATTDNAVITSTTGFTHFYTSDTLEGFDTNSRQTHVIGGTTDGTNSTTTVPVASTAKFHVGQEVFTRNEFTFTSLGTIASINSGVSIVLNTAPSSSIGSGTKIFISSYKNPSYIENQYHIACCYNDITKNIYIYLDGKLEKSQSIDVSSNFSMAQEDLFIGSNDNQGVGEDSATANKQFMGELHEMCMTTTIRNKFLINNLLPSLKDTLFYFRFEEIDE
tara:strand:- start:249 stop:1352 length:1104 start_codon:yes stop_codon:yes gene_type:complete